jgi:ferredoxin--NADP+ reductase
LPATELNSRIIKKIEPAKGLLILHVAPVGWELSQFFPGQYAMIGLPASAPRCAEADDELTEFRADMFFQRSFSICSTPDNLDYVEFYLTLVKSGALSPRLFALNEKDKLWMSKNFSGLFTLLRVPEDSNLIFIATGTGIAPCLCIIRSQLRSGTKRRIALIYGARHSWELGFADELDSYAKEHDNFMYITTISRPDDESTPWDGNTGYVQKYWKEGVVKRAWGFQPLPEKAHVFISGNPAMCDDVSNIMLSEGYIEQTYKKPGTLHLERFW